MAAGALIGFFQNDSQTRLRLSSGSDGNSDPETPPENRQCWICLATEEDVPGAEWLHPCRCRGTSKWVHEACLCRWIDEKQFGNMEVAVICTQCLTEYIIVVPPARPIDGMLEYLDTYYEYMCPTMVVGIVIATIYFSAVTYGALTVLQVIGYEDGMAFLNEAYPPLLLIGLPAIPVALLMGRMVHWDDMVISYIRSRRQRYERQQRQRRQHILEPNFGAPLEDPNFDNLDPSLENMRGTHERIIRASRNFISALILPTFSVLVGNLLFESIENRVCRAILGGLTFIGAKGIANIYMRQCKNARRRERIVLDYTEENVQRYVQIIERR